MPTTIQIKKNTREKLKRLGHKGESYDNIIERLKRKRSIYISG
jgi:predicted CopG family antitoxin